ncbi:MAG: hypothetical protein H6Q68_928 [Firmicutes bacterium]|nr:hypothetical protein [Bacillota bacterium]
MQSPIPPTKPTPPTPPSMKTSTTAPSTDTHTSTTNTPQSLNPSKAVSTSKEQSTPPPASAPESTNNLPPLASFSTSNNTSKEITSNTILPPTNQLSKNSSLSTGFSTFFVLIFIIAIALVAVHWWKNYKPKQGSTVDYSTESSDEIVNLILSQNNLESATQVIPKTSAKKILQQAESKPKSNGNFEVRV